MSVKVMGMVWDLELGRDEKFVLLAYADHADHEGRNIYPSVELMAWKTGYSERSIQAITRRLVEAGYLVADGRGTRGTNKWRIPISGGSIRGGAEFAPRKNCRVQKSAPMGAEIAEGGAGSAPGGVQKSAQGGAETAPEPSLTVREPLNDEEESSSSSLTIPDGSGCNVEVKKILDAASALFHCEFPIELAQECEQHIDPAWLLCWISSTWQDRRTLRNPTGMLFKRLQTQPRPQPWQLENPVAELPEEFLNAIAWDGKTDRRVISGDYEQRYSKGEFAEFLANNDEE